MKTLNEFLKELELHSNYNSHKLNKKTHSLNPNSLTLYLNDNEHLKTKSIEIENSQKGALWFDGDYGSIRLEKINGYFSLDRVIHAINLLSDNCIEIEEDLKKNTVEII